MALNKAVFKNWFQFQMTQENVALTGALAAYIFVRSVAFVLNIRLAYKMVNYGN
jgi:hypothetical protein